MKKRALIIITIILLLIILAYFFYPGCGFHRIGSVFQGQNVGEACICKIVNSICFQEGNYIEADDSTKQKINDLFSGNQ